MLKMPILVLALLPALYLQTAQKTGYTPGALFQSGDILTLRLEYDINAFRKDKSGSGDFHPARLTYPDQSGKDVTLEVRIKPRGKMRRLYLNCLVPLIKIKFDGTRSQGTLFQDLKSLKMVSHCKNRPGRFQDYYLREYLIYKLYNLLTPLSFRVRLARIAYKDSTGKVKPFTAYGFFIEDDGDVAGRNRGRTSDAPRIAPSQADKDTSALVAVFQFMIGNTDWDLATLRNTRVIALGETEKKYYPIPYDFDFSGLVDAEYARPDRHLPIKTVRERLYLGECRDEAQLNRIFMIFLRHKQEITNLYQTFPLLTEQQRERSIGYIEEFYRIIENPGSVKRYFINNYRGKPSD